MQYAFKPAEGILVCSGVYNPHNDYLFHLRNLFSQSVRLADEDAANDDDNENLTDVSIVVPSARKSSSTTSMSLKEQVELREALSRRNSFINYFDNKLNIPDVTVPNLLDAVNYILLTSGKK